MTKDQITLAAHQIGMYLEMKRINTPDGLTAWRAHNRAASELRERIGGTYQLYMFPNRALVKALYVSLREGLISRPEFASCLQNVMGKHK